MTREELSRYKKANSYTDEGEKYWDIPIIGHSMGFEKEIEKVQKRIEEWKREKEDVSEKIEEETSIEDLKNVSVPEVGLVRLVNLEKGLLMSIP